MLEARILQLFTIAAEERDLNRAAIRAGVMQMSLDRDMRTLEDKLGVTLLKREPSSLELTAAGQYYYNEARAVLAQLRKRCRKTAFAAQDSKTFTLSCSKANIRSSILLDSIKAFGAEFSHFDIEITEATPLHQIEALRKGRVDVAIGNRLPEHKEINSQLILSEPLLIAFPSKDHLSSAPYIEPDAIMDRSFLVLPHSFAPEVRNEVVPSLEWAGVKPSRLREAPSLESMLILISCGKGFGVFPRSTTIKPFEGVVFLPLVGMDATVDIYLSTHKELTNPQVKRFTSIYSEIVRQYSCISRVPAEPSAKSV